jgi:hypothetical protein
VASGRYGYLAMPWNAAIEGGVPLVYENEIMGASGVSGSSPRKTPLVQLRRAEFPPPSRLALRVQDDNHIAGWQARRFQ